MSNFQLMDVRASLLERIKNIRKGEEEVILVFEFRVSFTDSITLYSTSSSFIYNQSNRQHCRKVHFLPPNRLSLSAFRLEPKILGVSKPRGKAGKRSFIDQERCDGTAIEGRCLSILIVNLNIFSIGLILCKDKLKMCFPR